MTSAGASAHLESLRQFAMADGFDRAAQEARDTAARYEIAAVTEKAVARRLSALSAAGFTLLPDRGWPGSRTAQVDLVIVGPTGVFIVDTKAWKDVQIAAGHIYRGQEDVTEDLMNIAELAYHTEQVFAEVGLAPGEVHAVAVLAGRKGLKASIGPVDVVGEHDILQHITRGGQRLTSTQVNAVLAAALSHFPVLGAEQPIDLTIADPVLAYEVDQFDIASFDEVNSAITASMMAAPIETWMSFLHPDQARLVRRTFGGPSRVRGSAGTGKTVVALHRAAYLARATSGRVLVTTHSKSLPAVLSNLLRRMSPEVAGQVDFVGAHAFALRLLRERGIRCSIDPKGADAAFGAAWRDVGLSGPLALLDQSTRYWQDEIDYVIKGRGIRTFEPYADLARTGRRRQLRLEHRRAMWDLYVAYEQRLRAAGIHDFNDVISLAEASLRAQPLTTYRAVIVDEAQDLSCSTVRMLHSLVGNAPDGLTLIGDGRQTVYPGGYQLGEAGISLAGRGVVMTTNYRNTEQIISLASSMIAGVELTDIEGPDQSDATALVTRTGPAPVMTAYATRQQHDSELISRIDTLTHELGSSLADLAVLTLDRFSLAPVMLALSAAGIPTVDLDTYDGTPSNAVKVGTIKRAKGLEFKEVLIAGVKESLLSGPLPADPAALERHELQRRELYVGMTRARDGLWVGVVR